MRRKLATHHATVPLLPSPVALSPSQAKARSRPHVKEFQMRRLRLRRQIEKTRKTSKNSRVRVFEWSLVTIASARFVPSCVPLPVVLWACLLAACIPSVRPSASPCAFSFVVDFARLLLWQISFKLPPVT